MMMARSRSWSVYQFFCSHAALIVTIVAVLIRCHITLDDTGKTKEETKHQHKQQKPPQPTPNNQTESLKRWNSETTPALSVSVNDKTPALRPSLRTSNTAKYPDVAYSNVCQTPQGKKLLIAIHEPGLAFLLFFSFWKLYLPCGVQSLLTDGTWCP